MFESDAEEIFYHNIIKVLKTNLESQVKIRNYRIDFVIGEKIGVEIDGKYHNEKKPYDRIRDEYILNTGLIKAIVRINAKFIYDFPHLLIRLIAERYPNYFEMERVKNNFNQLENREENFDRLKNVRIKIKKCDSVETFWAFEIYDFDKTEFCYE